MTLNRIGTIAHGSLNTTQESRNIKVFPGVARRSKGCDFNGDGGIIPDSRSGRRYESRKLNVYGFMTLEAMSERHQDAVQDWVFFI
jgi:hypothetical protein